MTKDKTPETAEEILKKCFNTVFKQHTLHDWESFKGKSSEYTKLKEVYEIISSETSLLQKEKERLTKIIENKELREERHTGHIKALKEENGELKKLNHITISEWQLCPKCIGAGNVSAPPGSTNTTCICDICHGSKMLIKPVFSNEIDNLNKQLAAKQQLLDEMAEALQKAINVKQLWLPYTLTSTSPEYDGEFMVLQKCYDIFIESLTKYQNQKEGK